mmetsp:Transcript_9126/g.10423  ORF Transcript_9126/g.10423 Transcript_9126/m.10423 type:complete len:114 (-) Transcript_9126:653-994(-)
MWKTKEGKVDQPKLPKVPLDVGAGGLVKGGLGIRHRIQGRPPTKVAGQETRNGNKGKDHDDSLDAIGHGDRVETTEALENKNQEHDTNDRVHVVGIESKNTVERALDGKDLRG